MDLVKLTDEFFDEALVELQVSLHLLLTLHDCHWLEQWQFSVSHCEFQVLLHHVRQVAAELDHSLFWDGSDVEIVNQQVFLDDVLVVLVGLLDLCPSASHTGCESVLEFLVE